MPRIPTIKLDSQKTRARLRHTGLTQTEIAAKAGVSTSTVNKGLNGRVIGKLVARSIARALKTPLNDLLDGGCEPATAG